MLTIQDLSVLGLDIDLNNICKRAKVDIGTFCNYNCYFCYYKGKLNDKINPEIVKERIKKLYDLGCRDFDLSGGEPSIDKNLESYLIYIKELNKENKISCLSNGYGFTDIQKLKKLKDLGLEEILFSLHSVNEIHDKMVRIPGAFDKIIKAINNAKELNIKIRINSTITNVNYKYIDNLYLNLIEKINPSQVNFLPLNYFDNAKDLNSLDYNIILEPIKNFILYFKDKFDINVRYIPFCYFTGFEKYIKGYYQHVYDKQDWNMCYYEYKEPTKENFIKIIKDQRNSNYNKESICLKCKYFKICDGIEKQNKNKPKLIKE